MTVRYRQYSVSPRCYRPVFVAATQALFQGDNETGIRSRGDLDRQTMLYRSLTGNVTISPANEGKCTVSIEITF